MAKRKNKGGKCSCNPGLSILSAILIAAGVLLGIQGFISQLGLQGAWDSSALPVIFGYYIIAVLLVSAGKMVHYKASGSCSSHVCK